MQGKFSSIGVVALSILVLLSGCGKEGKESQGGSLSQNASGKIAGESWNFKFGTARYYAGSARWTISLHSADHQGDPCKAKVVAGTPLYFASFSLTDLKVGNYDASVESGRAVSLTRATDTSSGFSSSSVGSWGMLKITKAEGDVLEGQIDVKGNDSNFVKGSFTAKACR